MVWDFIVLDPDHCLSFYLLPDLHKIEIKKVFFSFNVAKPQVAVIQIVCVNVKMLNSCR